MNLDATARILSTGLWVKSKEKPPSPVSQWWDDIAERRYRLNIVNFQTVYIVSVSDMRAEDFWRGEGRLFYVAFDNEAQSAEDALFVNLKEDALLVNLKSSFDEATVLAAYNRFIPSDLREYAPFCDKRKV
jgi:hypothetical protein